MNGSNPKSEGPDLNLRRPSSDPLSPPYRVYICCGINCGPKGSRQLLDFLEEEVKRLALEDRVHVYPGGCQTHCESGPTMVVYPGPTFYQEVDRPRLQRIAREHFANDRPVADYFWQGPTARGKSFQGPSTGLRPAVTPGNNSSKPGREQKPRPKKTYDVDDFKW
jgi:(2Fe-2S) ferredoxin